MAGRKKDTMEIRELLRHIQTTASDRAVARATGTHRQTVARYRRWAGTQRLLDGPLPPLEELHGVLARTEGPPPPPAGGGDALGRTHWGLVAAGPRAGGTVAPRVQPLSPLAPERPVGAQRRRRGTPPVVHARASPVQTPPEAPVAA